MNILLNRVTLLALCASMAVSVSAQASAHPHFSPANSVVSAVGTGQIGEYECTAYIDGTTGAAHSAEASPHNTHTDTLTATIWNDGPGACTFAEFEAILNADGSFILTGNNFISTTCFPNPPYTGPHPVTISYPAGTAIITSTSPGTRVQVNVMYGGCNLRLDATDSSIAWHS